MSSSGLVLPSGDSAREGQDTGSGPNAPLPTGSIVPLPSISEPGPVHRCTALGCHQPVPSVVVISIDAPAVVEQRGEWAAGIGRRDSRRELGLADPGAASP